MEPEEIDLAAYKREEWARKEKEAQNRYLQRIKDTENKLNHETELKRKLNLAREDIYSLHNSSVAAWNACKDASL